MHWIVRGWHLESSSINQTFDLFGSVNLFLEDSCSVERFTLWTTRYARHCYAADFATYMQLGLIVLCLPHYHCLISQCELIAFNWDIMWSAHWSHYEAAQTKTLGAMICQCVWVLDTVFAYSTIFHLCWGKMVRRVICILRGDVCRITSVRQWGPCRHTRERRTLDGQNHNPATHIRQVG